MAVSRMDKAAICFDIAIVDINHQHIDGIIELQECEIEKDTFSTTNLQTFSYHQMEGYSHITKFTARFSLRS